LLNADDLDFCMELVGLAGWNQTPADWRRLMSLEPQGCFLAEWDGSRAGTATAIAYGQQCGWIGMVLVHPDYRRRGIGTALLKHCIEYLQGRAVRSIRLDATDQGRPLYLKLGFHDEYAVCRYEGRASGTTPPEPAGPGHVDIVPITGEVWAELCRLDRRAFGADRSGLLRALADDEPDLAVAATSRQRLLGYALARSGRVRPYIGPVVASGPEVAGWLVRALQERLGGDDVYIDVPQVNRRWCGWLEEAHLHVRRRLMRMYLGEPVADERPEMAFAISGFETG